MADNLLYGTGVHGMNTTRPIDSTTLRGNKNDAQIRRQVLTKVVIQEIPTRLYLSVGDFWTLDMESATIFDSPSSALEKTTNLKLQNVQLVLSRVTKEWEIIPVDTRIRSQTNLGDRGAPLKLPPCHIARPLV